MIETYLKEEEVNGVKVFKTFTKIESLKPDPQNPRDITEDKGVDLADFLSKYGSLKPLLVDIRPEKEGQLIGGNKRLEAYKKLGVSEVWIEPRDPITNAQAFEMGTIDNMQFGYYVMDKLTVLLKQFEGELDLGKLDAALANSAKNLQRLLQQAKDEDTKQDEPPAKNEAETISKLGEVYQLGRHRVMCGDAINLEDVTKLMNGQKADMVFTDPPYGYKYESNHQEKHEELLNDDKLLEFIPSLSVATKENCGVYVCAGWQTVHKWVDMVEGDGYKLKNIIIWKKNNWSMGDLTGAYAGQYEMILFFHIGRVELRGDRERDVWEFDREPPTDHPTMKPVELVVKAIRNTSDNENIILDLFGGSGSTLIACEQTNRTCYMMELDPKYCDVIRKRYAKFINREDWREATPAIADVQQTTQEDQNPDIQPEQGQETA